MEHCGPDSYCGGQNCIVLRRLVKDFVLEDDVLRRAGLPIRDGCSSNFSPEQSAAMADFFAALSAGTRHDPGPQLAERPAGQLPGWDEIAPGGDGGPSPPGTP